MNGERSEAEEGLRRRIARFAKAQTLRRRWISFGEIADYCAREDGSIIPDEQKRALAFDSLAEAALAGFFEGDGRSQILFLNPASNRFRMTGKLLSEAIDYSYDGARGRRGYLPYCWVRWEAGKRWFARQRLNVPPEWLAQVKCRQPVFNPTRLSSGSPNSSTTRVTMRKDSSPKKPTKMEKVAKALLERFPEGRPSLTIDELLREIAPVRGIGAVSRRTIVRAIPSAWPSSAPISAK